MATLYTARSGYMVWLLRAMGFGRLGPANYQSQANLRIHLRCKILGKCPGPDTCFYYLASTTKK